MPGPSDLADPCNLCLAKRIMECYGISEVESPEKFSLKAWNGTAVHEKLERDMPQVYAHGAREITVTIADIEGLGVIRGHIDLYLEHIATVTDYKTTDLDKLAKYRSFGVPERHKGQTMLYLYGLIREGKPADTATLAYIPRDSNRTSDIWVVSCAYQEAVAVALLERFRKLVEVVRSGATDGLASHPDCFVCNVQPFLTH